MRKTIHEINERIKEGNARVVTAEEMPQVVAELGEEGALAEVDVVTTGTFGAMCSSGCFFNFGHAEPPIRMEKVWLNDVEAYAGIAAVDAYLGATEKSTTREENYGAPTSSRTSLPGSRWSCVPSPGGRTATPGAPSRPRSSSRTATRRSWSTRGTGTRGTTLQ